MSRGACVTAVVLAMAGATLVGGELWLAAKAQVAAVLIDRAWKAHLADGGEHRPWPWADVVPVARIEVPRLGVRRTVLSGATGAALAFGLGHVDGTSRPGSAGNAVVAGHRDGRAAFLRDLVPGDEIVVRSRAGEERCVVSGSEVVAHDTAAVLDTTGEPKLTLVTCWPFGGLTRSPWRYVVWADCQVSHAG